MSMPPPVTPPPPPPMSAAPPPAGGVPVPNHMAWAIVSTVLAFCLCCGVGAIPGVVAIVFASQVNRHLDGGHFAEAQRASNNARIWCWVQTALAVLGLLYWIASFAMALSGRSPESMELLRQIEAARNAGGR